MDSANVDKVINALLVVVAILIIYSIYNCYKNKNISLMGADDSSEEKAVEIPTEEDPAETTTGEASVPETMKGGNEYAKIIGVNGGMLDKKAPSTPNNRNVEMYADNEKQFNYLLNREGYNASRAPKAGVDIRKVSENELASKAWSGM